MITVAGGIIEKDNLILIAQRHRDDTHGLKWEFPGGTLKPGESGEDAILRELKEELNIDVEIIRYFGYYVETPIRVQYYLLRYLTGKIRLIEHEQTQWVTKDSLLDYDLLTGDRIIANRLMKDLD
jgi:8-oxo-dGTP diphosphatase